MVRFYCFVCDCPVFLISFIERTVLSLLYSLFFVITNQLIHHTCMVDSMSPILFHWSMWLLFILMPYCWITIALLYTLGMEYNLDGYIFVFISYGCHDSLKFFVVPYEHTKFSFSTSVKNVIGILVRLTLNL